MVKQQHVGIFGDGQLARMLALSAHQIGLIPVAFGQKNSSAGQVCAQVVSADKTLSNTQLLSLNSLTFESEFFETAKIIKSKNQLKSKVFPSFGVMQKMQYRHNQKQILIENKLSTAFYFELFGPGDLAPFFNSEINNQWVFKKNFGGYDGYGTFFWPRDLEKIRQMLETSPQSTYPILIAEPLISFKRELALTAARNAKNQIVFYPLVETVQKNGQCDYVTGPVTHRQEKPLKLKVKKLLQRLNYVGVITFEIFDTNLGLLINEIAPRVHNSAHYTQNACDISQFELHWRCGLNLELSTPKLLTPHFAMINLLGTKKSKTIKVPTANNGALHWYGKTESRPKRKLGHLNLLGEAVPQLLKLGLQQRKKMSL